MHKQLIVCIICISCAPTTQKSKKKKTMHDEWTHPMISTCKGATMLQEPCPMLVASPLNNKPKKKKIVNNKLHKHRFRQLPGDIERLASASVAPEGALRWRAGLTGPSRSSWLGRAGLVCTTVGAGVIETEGARCMRSTGSGMRGGRSA